MAREREFHFVVWSDGTITTLSRQLDTKTNKLGDYVDTTLYTAEEAAEMSTALANASKGVPA